MMLVEVINKIDTVYSKVDTVYVQHKLDSISQLDMGQYISTINSTHDSNMTIILWILGFAFGFIGFIIPYSLKLYDKNQFKNKIKEAVIADFDKKIEEKIKELELKIENGFKKTLQEIDIVADDSAIMNLMFDAKTSYNRSSYLDALSATVNAIRIIIDSYDSSYLDASLSYLEKIDKEYIQNNQLIINNTIFKNINEIKTNYSNNEEKLNQKDQNWKKVIEYLNKFLGYRRQRSTKEDIK